MYKCILFSVLAQSYFTNQDEDELERIINEHALLLEQLSTRKNEAKTKNIARLVHQDTEVTQALEKIQAEHAKLKADYTKLKITHQKDVRHLKNERRDMTDRFEKLYDDLNSRYETSQENASKLKGVQEQTQQKLEDAQKSVEWLRDKWAETVNKYNAREEMWRIETQKKDTEALQMHDQIDEINKELKNVITKGRIFEFKDSETQETWIVLHEGGINCLVDVSQFEKFVRENSISMIDTQISHSEIGEYYIQFQKNLAVTMQGDETNVSIDLQYDTAMQLFAWMKDKLNNSGDLDEKSKLTNLTGDNLLSHEFLLQMQQDQFECPVCYRSNGNSVVVCLSCNHRMHKSCCPGLKCPMCGHAFTNVGIDYEDLAFYTEMRPSILQEPLEQIEDPELRKRLKPLHLRPMRTEIPYSCEHENCVY